MHHLLLRAVCQPDRLGAVLAEQLVVEQDTPLLSATSLWEIAIRTGLGRPDFDVDPRLLRRGLLRSGCEELSVASAQAAVQGVSLLTRDEQVAATAHRFV